MLANCCASCANADIAYETYSFQTEVNRSSCLYVWHAVTADKTKLEEYSCNGTVAQMFTVLNAGHGAIHLYNPHSGKCVDDFENGATDGNQMEIYHCNATAAQTYYAHWNDDDSFTFEKTDAPMCIDVNPLNPADGTKVQVWGCNGTAAQSWFPVSH
jgi:beta-glucosidase